MYINVINKPIYILHEEAWSANTILTRGERVNCIKLPFSAGQKITLVLKFHKCHIMYDCEMYAN